MISFFINKERHFTDLWLMDGLTIRGLGRIPSDYDVWVEAEPDDVKVREGTTVIINEGTKIYSAPKEI